MARNILKPEEETFDAVVWCRYIHHTYFDHGSKIRINYRIWRFLTEYNKYKESFYQIKYLSCFCNVLSFKVSLKTPEQDVYDQIHHIIAEILNSTDNILKADKPYSYILSIINNQIASYHKNREYKDIRIDIDINKIGNSSPMADLLDVKKKADREINRAKRYEELKDVYLDTDELKLIFYLKEQRKAKLKYIAAILFPDLYIIDPNKAQKQVNTAYNNTKNKILATMEREGYWG